MRNAKIKFRLKNTSYYYPNDEDIKLKPYVIVTMDENISRVMNENTGEVDASNMARLDAFEDGKRSFELSGHVDSIDTCLLIFLYSPENDSDHTPVYTRTGFSFVAHHITIHEALNRTRQHKLSVQLQNILKQPVASYEFEFESSEFPKEILERNDAVDRSLSTNLVGWEQRMNIFRQKCFNFQSLYDKRMNEFIAKHFPYTFSGTRTMTLFNDFFGFEAKSLFYGFAYQRPQPTNAAFWQYVYQVVFQLFYAQECNRKYSPKETFKRLTRDEKLIILCDMYIFVSTTSSYLTDFARSLQNEISRLGGKKVFKENIKYTEDFCPIHGGWSGDCEDFTQFIKYMSSMFAYHCKDITKEEHPELFELQKLARKYVCFFGLCGVERASTESKKAKPSAHMAAFLFRRKMLSKLKVVFRHSANGSKQLEDEMEARFKKIISQFDENIGNDEDDENDSDLPNVLVCEGTGYLRSIVRDKPLDLVFKDKVDLPEYVKERVVMTRTQVPFYQYVFEILNNDMIDGNLNIQSFVLTYDEDQAIQVNPNVEKGSFEKGKYQYGVKIRDILENPEKIVLVATPLIDNETIKNNKKLALQQMPYPPCHRVSVTSPPSKWFSISDVYPMVDPISELESIKKRHASKIISETEGFGPIDPELLKQLELIGKGDSPTLTYMMVAPRNLDSTLDILLKVIDEKQYHALSIVRVFEDHCTIIIWISLIG